MLIGAYLLTDPNETPRYGWLRIDGQTMCDMGYGNAPGPLDAGGPETLLTPGFIDAHNHWPQWDVVGYDGMTLLDWLDQVVFPAECTWADGSQARLQTSLALKSMIAAGTTGCAAFLTSHAQAVSAALDALNEYPVRCLIGRVLMDREAPDELCFACTGWSSADLGAPALAAGTMAQRVTLSVNPRFAVACSPEALTAAGRLAVESGAAIHTHFAESLGECNRVAQLYPESSNYLSVYESHGLLQPGTLLAHAIHLSDDEWRLAQLRDVVLVHCPTANTFLESGAFDWATARRHGIRVALGSDRAAGPDIAMPRVARAMIETCKWRNLMARQAGRDDSLSVPSAADAWRLITTGNADALGWSDAGRLEPGAAADILLLQPGRSFPFDPDDPHLISRLLYNWSDEIIDHVVLNGTLIHRAAMLRNA